MSLINDVLRDLEQRRQVPSSNTLRGVRPPLSPPRQARRLWLFALPLVGGLGWAAYSADVLMPPVAPEAHAAAAAVAPDPAAPVQVPAVAALPPLAQLRGLSLSQSASRLQAMLSLSEPVTHRVERAADGRVVSLVLEGVELQGVLPAPGAAASLLQGLDLRPEGERLLIDFTFAQAVRVQTAVESRGAGAVLVLEAVSVSPARPEVVARAVTPEPPGAEPASAPGPAAAAAFESPAQQAKPSFQKMPAHLSPGELAAQAYAEGAQHLRSGHMAAALAAWERALAQDPSHRPARGAAAELLLNLGRTVEAEELLRQAHRRWPADSGFAEQYGRMLIGQGRDADALAVLEAARPALVGDGEYLALLAAVYQRLGRYAESAEAYGRVLGAHPQREVWWMGLGITLEGAAQTQAAAKAYRRALALPGLGRELRAYAEGRLRSLATQK